jgi:hypothetical protein
MSAFTPPPKSMITALTMTGNTTKTRRVTRDQVTAENVASALPGGYSVSHPESLLRNFKGTTEQALRLALEVLYTEQVDYLTRNKLGGLDNHAMRLAREALAFKPRLE